MMICWNGDPAGGVVKKVWRAVTARSVSINPPERLYSPLTVMLPRPPPKLIPASPRTR